LPDSCTRIIEKKSRLKGEYLERTLPRFDFAVLCRLVLSGTRIQVAATISRGEVEQTVLIREAFHALEQWRFSSGAF
jgi:hypothetical protein